MEWEEWKKADSLNTSSILLLSYNALGHTINIHSNQPKLEFKCEFKPLKFKREFGPLKFKHKILIAPTRMTIWMQTEHRPTNSPHSWNLQNPTLPKERQQGTLLINCLNWVVNNNYYRDGNINWWGSPKRSHFSDRSDSFQFLLEFIPFPVPAGQCGHVQDHLTVTWQTQSYQVTCVTTRARSRPHFPNLSYHLSPFWR